MKATLIGVKDLDFKANDGKQVSGINLFVVHKETGTEGYSCRKLFVNKSDSDVITIDPRKYLDKPIEIDLGFGGKVVCISAV